MAPAAEATAVSWPEQPQPTMQATAANPAAAPTPQAAGQHDAADAAMYREMRTALCEFDSSGSPKESPPRHRAFFTALRSVLGQVLEEKTEASRHVRLLAAHQWYVKHKPRPRPIDMAMAAAMAASLSVQNPAGDVSTLASAFRARIASPVGCNAARRQQQKQQACQVADAQQQLFGSYNATDAEHQPGVCRTNTSRWREQQALRLHELEDEASIAAVLDSTYSHADALHTNRSTGSETARPASCPVTTCLPEQSSLRAVPAIQASASASGAPAATGGLNTGAVQGLLVTPRAGSKPGAAATAGRPGTTSKATAAALPPTDGLIPGGSLPSGRFMSGSGNGGCGGTRYDFEFAQLRAVADQQQQVQDAVAAHMRGYARHRARLEEEINRKQEVAVQIQLAATQQKLHSASQGGVCADGPAGTTAGPGSRPAAARVLLHVDSQHQPSQVETAYTGLDAGPGWVHRLAPVDKVKEVKQVLLQDSQRECAEVTEQMMKLGIAAHADAVRHALLPLPDKPYMTCMAHLPEPGRRSSSTTLKSKDKKKKKKPGKKGNTPSQRERK